MSKTISDTLKNHMNQPLTTVAICWKIIRTDGEKFFLTSHDVDLEFDGDIYEASAGMLPSQISQKRDISVDNLEAITFLSSDQFKEADIIAGLFDHGFVDIFIVNYKDYEVLLVT